MSASFRLLTRFDINTMPWSAMTRRQRALHALVAEYRREHCRRFHKQSRPFTRRCRCWEEQPYAAAMSTPDIYAQDERRESG